MRLAPGSSSKALTLETKEVRFCFKKHCVLDAAWLRPARPFFRFSRRPRTGRIEHRMRRLVALDVVSLLDDPLQFLVPVLPSSNSRFWRTKLSANRRRDALASARLRRSGWHVLTVWECDLRRESLERLLRRTVAAHPARGRACGSQRAS